MKIINIYLVLNSIFAFLIFDSLEKYRMPLVSSVFCYLILFTLGYMLTMKGHYKKIFKSKYSLYLLASFIVYTSLLVNWRSFHDSKFFMAHCLVFAWFTLFGGLHYGFEDDKQLNSVTTESIFSSIKSSVKKLLDFMDKSTTNKIILFIVLLLVVASIQYIVRVKILGLSFMVGR